jgi:tetratricopeptide (TPR) repeat protein
MRTPTFCLVAWLFFPAAATAEDDAGKAASRALLKQGNERLDKDKYQQALEKFEQAYERFPSPKIFFSEGQALRGLNRNADALRAFQRFADEAEGVSDEIRKEAQSNISQLSALVNQDLSKQASSAAAGRQMGPTVETASGRTQLLTRGLALRGLGRNVDAMLAFERFLADAKDASGEDRREAETNIAKLTTLIGRLEINCNRSDALAAIDGQTLPAAPFPHLVWVNPGDHQVTLEWEGEKTSALFFVAAGQSVSPEGLNFEDKRPLPTLVAATAPAPVVAVQEPAQAPVPAPAPSWRRSTWVWIGAGAVVLAVGTGLLLVYGSRDHYPSTGFGTQAIGGGP